MSSGDLTVYNPQQVKVMAEVHLPGKGTQSKLLSAGEQWVITGGSTKEQWVAFFNPETQELLSAALLPDNSTIAQILVEVGVNGVLRLNPTADLIVTNGIDQTVTAVLQDVGKGSAEHRGLAPRENTSFNFDERGQWLGFYDAQGRYITSVEAGSFSEVNLLSSKRKFVIGTPYPVSGAAATAGTVHVTLPPTHKG